MTREWLYCNFCWQSWGKMRMWEWVGKKSETKGKDVCQAGRKTISYTHISTLKNELHFNFSPSFSMLGKKFLGAGVEGSWHGRDGEVIEFLCGTCTPQKRAHETNPKKLPENGTHVSLSAKCFRIYSSHAIVSTHSFLGFLVHFLVLSNYTSFRLCTAQWRATLLEKKPSHPDSVWMNGNFGRWSALTQCHIFTSESLYFSHHFPPISKNSSSISTTFINFPSTSLCPPRTRKSSISLRWTPILSG